jgi:transketolase
MRGRILDISLTCNGNVHMGGGLSLVEILATLYGTVLKFDPKNPQWEERDRFILSKGHGVLGFFAALVESGIISEEVFNSFKKNESDLIAHPVMNSALGIESSNGSLGQGLSFAVGLALAARKKKAAHGIYVVLGDGECDEGMVWEAAMSAAHYKLEALTAIVDLNRYQSDGESVKVLNTSSLHDKWTAFGWEAVPVDGHDVAALLEAFKRKAGNSKPKVVIAHTVKGKGISFMENNNEWHHNRLTKSSYDKAIVEIRGGTC